MESAHTPFFNEDPPKRTIIDFGNVPRHSFLPIGFSEDEITSRHITIRKVQDDIRPLVKFCTGSKYLGEWNDLGIAGRGVYKYPHGVIYDGYFNNNGEFHGSGTLIYPSGQKIEGIWKNGKLSSDCTFVNKEGIPMSEHYCRMPDRRFQVEIEDELNPAGQEYLTNARHHDRSISKSCFDTGEGVYKIKLRSVYAYLEDESSDEVLPGATESSKHVELHPIMQQSYMDSVFKIKSSELKYAAKDVLIDIPTLKEEMWILTKCRRGMDVPVGYKPSLYEVWTKGTKDEVDTIFNDNPVQHEQTDNRCDNAPTLQLQKSSPAVSIISFSQRKNEHKLSDSSRVTFKSDTVPPHHHHHKNEPENDNL